MPDFDTEQADDGTWTIYQVPIFSTHTDDRGAEPETYDATWLNAAVTKAKAREAEGYLGPVHLSHHGNGKEPTFAGHFRVTGVRPFRYEGEDLPTIFADLTGIPPEVFERIEQGRYPFRSVEIPGPEKPEILSLALLDHEVPFFRYGVLKVRREESKEPLVARCYQDTPHRREHLVFAFGGPVPKTLNGARSTRTLFQEEEEENGEETTVTVTTEEPAGEKSFADARGTQEMLQELGATLAKAGELVAAMAQTEEPAAVSPPEQAPDAPAEEEEPEEAMSLFSQPDGVAATQFGDTPTPEAYQELVGRCQALEDQVTKLTAKASHDLDGELRSLMEAGGTDFEAVQFKALAEKSPSAAKAYAAMARRFLASQTQAPPAFHNHELPAPSMDPPEVQAYAAQGPEAMERARRVYGLWEKSSKRHTAEKYLRCNMDPVGFLESQE